MTKSCVAIFIALLTVTNLTACQKASPPPAANAPASAAATANEIKITVDDQGYHPESAKAQAGKPARLIFTRTSDYGCGQEVVFPSLNIKRELPLDKPITIDVTMPASGELAFTCGMAMYKGSIVAQ